jgi:cell division protein FtsB
MSAPDPEGMSMFAKVLGAGALVVTPVWGFFKLWNKKADKHAVTSQLQAVHAEMGTLRQTQAKIFDHMRDDRAEAEKRHREILMHLLERKR